GGRRQRDGPVLRWRRLPPRPVADHAGPGCRWRHVLDGAGYAARAECRRLLDAEHAHWRRPVREPRRGPVPVPVPPPPGPHRLDVGAQWRHAGGHRPDPVGFVGQLPGPEWPEWGWDDGVPVHVLDARHVLPWGLGGAELVLRPEHGRQRL